MSDTPASERISHIQQELALHMKARSHSARHERARAYGYRGEDDIRALLNELDDLTQRLAQAESLTSY